MVSTACIGVFSLLIGNCGVFLRSMGGMAPSLGFVSDPATLTLMD